MDPRQFRIRCQPDAALLVATAQPNTFGQAISAGERMQAQALTVALLQAQAMHRAKTIMPTGVINEEINVIVVDPPAAPPTSLISEWPIEVNELPTYHAEETTVESTEAPVQTTVTPETWLATAELRDLVKAAPEFTLPQASPPAQSDRLPVLATPVRRWWLVGLLLLPTLGIAVVICQLASWQIALAWLGGVAGAGYLWVRNWRKRSRAKRS